MANSTNIEDKTIKDIHGKSSWTPFFRQLFVVNGVWTIYFVLGLCYGAPNVTIPQIRKEANSTEAVSEDMASWLTSIHGYSALPWIIILPILTRTFGRRLPFLILCITTIIACGPMILACSVYGELTPIRYRSSSLPILAIFSEVLMATVLKISPNIFKVFGLHGAFLFYGITSSVFAFLLYKYLPESKDKTLQEIEIYFIEIQRQENIPEQLKNQKDS
ncbi:unnamed protein product [Arctia plantaginis]|uniref:Sugar transporter n=1 Tax=Arctia plantaginis TaxID=874455 RepID=A0A8S0ZRN1_ARCPL|nr:unnamed protein product [Arctia plantaginis]CAB3250773.1 unnamed protein product [Arctia plantaginis]